MSEIKPGCPEPCPLIPGIIPGMPWGAWGTWGIRFGSNGGCIPRGVRPVSNRPLLFGGGFEGNEGWFGTLKFSSKMSSISSIAPSSSMSLNGLKNDYYNCWLLFSFFFDIEKLINKN